MEAKVLLAGLLMVFGSTSAAFYVRIPSPMRNPWMNQPFFALVGNLGGVVTGFYSAYFLGSRLGWLPGIGIWAVGGLTSAAIISSQMSIYPLMFMLGLVAMASGFALAVL